MKAIIEPPNHVAGPRSGGEQDPEKVKAVRQELDKVLASRFFKSAGRSRQFLQYVVEHKLEGHPDLLKERTIGTEVFQRSPGYATGDDPVVRVQAGEVRRRLEQYYQAASDNSPTMIELPVGSYSPVFHWPSERVLEPQTAAVSAVQPQKAPWSRGRWLLAAICGVLILACVPGLVLLHRATHRMSVIEQFWSPIFATQQPVLICLAKSVSYRPSAALYERYSRAHSGTFETEVERSNKPLPLDPNEKLTWNDMALFSDYGVALGDTYAAVSLSGLLGKIGKASQVRIGSSYSFEDLRNSPAVVVGAFNNRWTIQLTANLHFAFVEQNGHFMIREQVPGGRTWLQQTTPGGDVTNFAIVGRLLDSKTGQFTVSVAGISGNGTQAAAEFVSSPEFMEKGLRDAPADWQKKNMQLVIQTTVTDSITGPPRVVAAYYW